MDETLQPSATSFVVQSSEPEDLKALRTELSAQGVDVEVLAGAVPCTVLRLAREDAEPKVTWRRWMKRLTAKHPHIALAPVLLDGSGQAHYPTGELVIRFARSLPQDELESFAKVRGLRVSRRNAYVPQQVVFEEMESQDRFLPDRVRELRADPAIVAAWPNTWSGYRRE